jgi:hypothetical protein
MPSGAGLKRTLSDELAVLDIASQPPRPARLELPPEPEALRVSAERTVTDEAVTAVAARASRQRRRRLGAMVAFLLLLLGGWWVRGRLSRPPSLPADVLAAKDVAFQQLRRDDARSRHEAMQSLGALVGRYPEAVDIRADYVLAQALELDDLKVRIQHHAAEARRLREEIGRLQARRSPMDWESQVERHVREIEALKLQSDPWIQEASDLDARLNGVFQELLASLGGEETHSLPVLRAQAVYWGVRGSDQAITLSERYRQGAGTDGWGAIAFAEYALNGLVPPQTPSDALEALGEVKARDSGLVRTYVLSARLQSLLKASEGAILDLEGALSLNRSHALAAELLGWARAQAPVEREP